MSDDESKTQGTTSDMPEHASAAELIAACVRLGFGAVSALFGRDGVTISGDGLLAYALHELGHSEETAISVQTLPVVYVVERWLHAFQEVGMHFRVLFVADWDGFWQPPWVCLRRLLLRHLQANCQGLIVDVIPSASGTAWDKYCSEHATGSFMLQLDSWEPFVSTAGASVAAVLILRCLMLRRGVTLLSGAGVRGQMYVSNGDLMSFFLHPVWSIHVRKLADRIIAAEDAGRVGTGTDGARSTPAQSLAACGTQLLVSACAEFVRLNASQQNDAVAFVCAVLLSQAIATSWSLPKRSISATKLPFDRVADAEPVPSTLRSHVLQFLTCLGEQLCDGTTGPGSSLPDRRLPDLVDMRLVRHVRVHVGLTSLADFAVKLPAAQRQRFSDLWRSLAALVPQVAALELGEEGFTASETPASETPASETPASASETPASFERSPGGTVGESTAAAAAAAGAPEGGSAPDVTPQPGLEGLLACLGVDCPAATEQIPLAPRIFTLPETSANLVWIPREEVSPVVRYAESRTTSLFHWHSGRPLDDEYAELDRPQGAKPRKLWLKQQQRSANVVNLRAMSMIGGPIQKQTVTSNSVSTIAPSKPVHVSAAALQIRQANTNKLLSEELAELRHPVTTPTVEKFRQRLIPFAVDDVLVHKGHKSQDVSLLAKAVACNLVTCSAWLQHLVSQWTSQSTISSQTSLACELFQACCESWPHLARASAMLTRQAEAETATKTEERAATKKKLKPGARPSAAASTGTTPSVVDSGTLKELRAEAQQLAIGLLGCWSAFDFGPSPEQTALQELLASVGGRESSKAVSKFIGGLATRSIKQVVGPHQRLYGFRVRRWDQVSFQLMHMGPRLARPVGTPDERVNSFHPDDWQRNLLDIVDAGKSALVVAPTSSGKTFISYYVMERILRCDSVGLVMYIAPTKALVNQVYAEIYARFDKDYSTATGPSPARHVAGIFTRESRSHMHSCQILVTVPACASIIMLSAAQSAWNLRQRMRYAIFDEVHNIIGDQGSTWEQLLCAVPCPFIALSATIGNCQQFVSWLDQLERCRGRECTLIEYSERHNDLSYHQWSSSGQRTDQVSCAMRLGDYVHSAAPEAFSFSLLPTECLVLYEIIHTHRAAVGSAHESCPALLNALEPASFFGSASGVSNGPRMLTKTLVSRYERQLCSLLRTVATHAPALSTQICSTFVRASEGAMSDLDASLDRAESYDLTGRELLHLLRHLDQGDRLPAIVFELDPFAGHRLGKALLHQLRKEQADFAPQRARDRAALRKRLAGLVQMYRTIVHGHKKVCGPDVMPLRDSISDAKRQLDALSAPEPSCCFVPRNGLPSWSILCQAFGATRSWSMAALRAKLGSRLEYALLRRGVGLHDATLSAPYRSAVEYLFRCGHLKVVIATSTLSQGIHMPCRSVVFADNHVHFNALSFRQMSGRAGRRNFDNEGHVVFLAVPSYKARHLLACTPPPLVRCATMTAEDTVRLLLLYTAADSDSHEDRQERVAILAAARRMIFCSFLASHVPHIGAFNAAHVQFVVQFLTGLGMVVFDSDRRMHLTALSTVVAHLFYTKSSAFVFSCMLQQGVLDSLVRSAPNESERSVRLLSVLSLLFGRQPLHPMLAAQRSTFVMSKVVFDASKELDPYLLQFIQAYNRNALRGFNKHLRGFLRLNPHVAAPELPISGLRFDGQAAKHTPARKISVLSPFIALAGIRAKSCTAVDLVNRVPHQLRLDLAGIPILAEMPLLNRYLLDFFNHGQLKALVHDNCMKESDAYFAIQDFLSILKVIFVALKKSNESAAAASRSAGSSAVEEAKADDSDIDDTSSSDSSDYMNDGDDASNGDAADVDDADEGDLSGVSSSDPVMAAVASLYSQLHAKLKGLPVDLA